MFTFKKNSQFEMSFPPKKKIMSWSIFFILCFFFGSFETNSFMKLFSHTLENGFPFTCVVTNLFNHSLQRIKPFLYQSKFLEGHGAKIIKIETSRKKKKKRKKCDCLCYRKKRKK